VINKGLVWDGTVTGAQPKATSTYGQYDNGANVFNFYDNFAGTTLSSKWTIVSSPTITVNNGLTLGSNAGILATSSFTTANDIFDTYWEKTSSSRNLDYGLLLDYTPSSDIGWLVRDSGYDGTNTVAWWDKSGSWTKIGTGTYTLPTQTTMHISSAVYVSPYMYYSNNEGNWLQLSSSSTAHSSGSVGYRIGLTGAQVFIQWSRVRAYPPNGVMPVVNRYYCCLRNLL
jgi:hypothetical protein